VKKWVLIGLALVMSASVVAGIFYSKTTPGKIDRSQNKVVPVALNIMPAAQALQATLDVADMHADSLLWKRDLLDVKRDHQTRRGVTTSSDTGLLEGVAGHQESDGLAARRRLHHSDDSPFEHHGDAVAERDDFVQFRGDDE